MNDLWLFEKDHVWHPYAAMNPSMQKGVPVYPVKSAAGVRLTFEDV